MSDRRYDAQYRETYLERQERLRRSYAKQRAADPPAPAATDAGDTP